MSLLREIQNAAIDSDSNLEALLRRCRVLASRLQNEEFKTWVQAELDGYLNGAETPNYRRFSGHAYGHFVGYGGRQLKNAQIPETCIPEDLRDQLLSIDMRQGIGALTDLVKDSETALQLLWPADAYPIFGDRIYQGMNLIQAWLSIPKNVVVGILSTVRNRVLNFALEIEATNPDAGEAPPNTKPIPEEQVSQIFNYYVYGNVGSMASGSDITQTVHQQIHSGDFKALAAFLKDVGFTASDVSELKSALQAEPQPPKEGFGPKVAGWIGKAVGKVAQGGLKLTTSVASDALAEVIKSYYGI